jgi:tRNA A-37 threonylcarbamoyl transferase component Bud32
MAELRIGDVFAGHRIDALVGRGGMGVVYQATDLALERRVALKLIAPELAQNQEFRLRFERESRTAASIRHPNVVTVFHAGEAEGLLYITMDYVDGTDLRAMVASLGPLQPPLAVDLVIQVARGLDAAHANGLVHRDVKPANILVEHASGIRAYLTDFGVTRHLTSNVGLTKTGDWVGTLDYIAPEQIRGEQISARADIYSLGCVLVEVLSGEVPFPRDTDVAKIWAHVNEPPPLIAERSNLGPPWDEVVQRAMSKDPAGRFASAGDLGRAALAALQGRPAPIGGREVASGAASAGLSATQPRVATGPVEQVAVAPGQGPVRATTQAAVGGVRRVPVSRFALWRSAAASAIADHKVTVVAALLLAAGGVVAAAILVGPLNRSSSSESSLKAAFPPKLFAAADCESRSPSGPHIEEQVACTPTDDDGRRIGALRFYRYGTVQDKKVAYGSARRLAISRSATPLTLSDCDHNTNSTDGYWYRESSVRDVGGQALCYTTNEGISHLVVIYSNSAVLMEGVGSSYPHLWDWFHRNVAPDFSPPPGPRSTA